jgi:hypothetical protein
LKKVCGATCSGIPQTKSVVPQDEAPEHPHDR